MSERLDRIERIVESLARGQEHLLSAAETQDTRMERLLAVLETQGKRIDILIEAQLASQAQMGLISEQTLQLKRAVDYLLSQDGGQPQPQGGNG